jgi:predicted metallopeptidase/uncharacterized protein YraI
MKMGLISVTAAGAERHKTVDRKTVSKREPKRDLNHEFERLLALICGSISEFALYDTSKIAVSISRSRRQGRAGTLAYVVPLRYVGGGKERKGRRWGISGFYSFESPQVERDHPSALYIMTFLVPKFFSLKTRDRLETLVHELYHLHPSLRGDLRRFAPPHIHHGPTPALYQRKVQSLCQELLLALPTIEQHPLLCQNESEIGAFGGRRFNIPKHVFKPKPFGLFAAGAVLFLSSIAAHAAQVPVVIIKDGSMHVAPQTASGVETTIKRGQNFTAYKLSEDRKWVWVGNDSTKGWVHRDYIQSESLDRRLGFAGAYADHRVPNKLKEKKVGDPLSAPIEKDRPLRERNKDDDTLAALAELGDTPDEGDVALKDGQAPLPQASIMPITGAGGGASGFFDPRGDLEEDPSAEQLADLNLSPEEKSHLEEGERVSKAQLRAQSRLSPIKRNQFQFKNESGATSPSENGIVTWEENFDPDRDRANVTNPGKLFERPDENSKRYGILEQNDDVLPLAHTEDGRWLRVRLQETGEEGWFPAASIRVTQADRQISTVHHNSFEVHGDWGSRGYNFGFGAGYFFNFGHDDKNRSWGLGLDYSMWSGQQLAFQGKTYVSNYTGIQFIGRYNIPSQQSNFAASIDGGLGYFKANIQTDGISENVLIENGLTSAASAKLVPLMGGTIGYGLAKHFDVMGLVRFQISSTAVVYTGLGIRGKF